MAELTDSPPPDLVTCVCGRQSDRNVFSQCPDCLTNLWELDRAGAPSPAPVAAPAAGRSSGTVLDPHQSGPADIDILVCGRRVAVGAGHTVRLGRDEGLETYDVFRDAMNVSRRHAELRFDGENVFVTDTGSSNGTFVNDHRLPVDTEYQLSPGQTLRLASNVPIDIEWEQ
jgi:pSer/pThr/pTyr-binding forkhead associated (FHA) protein